MRSKLGLSMLSLCLLAVSPASAHETAEYTHGPPPGWTSIINCKNNPGADIAPLLWGSPTSDWGQKKSIFVWHDSRNLGGNEQWNYANFLPPDPQGGSGSGECQAWVDGSLYGGATMPPSSPGAPQGVTFGAQVGWYNFNWPDFYNQGQCGHQHMDLYLYGWRWHGSFWTIELANSGKVSTYWDSSAQYCRFKGTGNPDYTGIFTHFAYNDSVLTISNSPYTVIYVKTQASSHTGGGQGGCGRFECFHPILSMAWTSVN